jgi:hypothetical protein
MAEFPVPREGFVLTHFIVTSDVGRSRRFYAGVLGGEVLLEGQPTIVALANSWTSIARSRMSWIRRRTARRPLGRAGGRRPIRPLTASRAIRWRRS